MTRGGGIVKIVDEILSGDPDAAGLGINWQVFGSNGHDKADYSRGVLERFTRRAPSDWAPKELANAHVKTISNPRLICCVFNPHFAVYVDKKFAANSAGERVMNWKNYPILSDKIVINHYYIKSREEYFKKKMPKGWSCPGYAPYGENHFKECDRNDVFDDGILKYRDERAKNFSFVSDNDRISRVVNCLAKTLTEPHDLETFLTCRAVAEKFQIKIYGESAEEISLVLIYQILKGNPITYAEMQMFLKDLPEILSRPFPVCKDIKNFIQNFVLPGFCKSLKTGKVYHEVSAWMARSELQHIQKLLNLIKY